MHFTHVTHLPGIIAGDLLSDAIAQATGQILVEVGNLSIKERRKVRVVPVQPRGFVGDYVPFYFAPRSPMMYSIEQGNVETYQDGCDRLIYLVTNLEKLEADGLAPLLTDRNAVLKTAEFRRFVDYVDDDFIDWPLMDTGWWNNTSEFPDRKERRMAECLVKDAVPWDSIVVSWSSPTPLNRRLKKCFHW